MAGAGEGVEHGDEVASVTAATGELVQGVADQLAQVSGGDTVEAEMQPLVVGEVDIESDGDEAEGPTGGAVNVAHFEVAHRLRREAGLAGQLRARPTQALASRAGDALAPVDPQRGGHAAPPASRGLANVLPQRGQSRSCRTSSPTTQSTFGGRAAQASRSVFSASWVAVVQGPVGAVCVADELGPVGAAVGVLCVAVGRGAACATVCAVVFLRVTAPPTARGGTRWQALRRATPARLAAHAA